MLINETPPIHLTYCMNVHPGESWPEVFSAIQSFPSAVRERVAPGKRFGIGLRLGNQAVAELAADPAQIGELKAFLHDADFYVFTINGFPYGKFHGTQVKEGVYRPDWSTRERKDYTLRLARLLADILPAGQSGSISTVPLSFRAWKHTPDREEAMIAHLGETALAMDRMLSESGRQIHLGLEPEPDCLLETTPETIDFFRNRLFTEGPRSLARNHGCSHTAAEKILRRHIGVCLDTCHMALQFESPAESLRSFLHEGIRVSKIQISAALRISPSKETVEVLRSKFMDTVYLHQVKARTGKGKVISLGDLPKALESAAVQNETLREWRIHFHVPLHVRSDEFTGSTVETLNEDFFSAALDSNVEHMEIETYTFDVLPEEFRDSDIVDSISGEYVWFLRHLPKSYKTK